MSSTAKCSENSPGTLARTSLSLTTARSDAAVFRPPLRPLSHHPARAACWAPPFTKGRACSLSNPPIPRSPTPPPALNPPIPSCAALRHLHLRWQRDRHRDKLRRLPNLHCPRQRKVRVLSVHGSRRRRCDAHTHTQSQLSACTAFSSGTAHGASLSPPASSSGRV